MSSNESNLPQKQQAARVDLSVPVRSVGTLKSMLATDAMQSTMKTVLPYRNVRDYSTGFRAYDSAIINRLMQRYGDRLVEQSGFACMLELLAKLRTVGARVVEIPYTLRYDQKLGASKLRIFRTLKQYWAVISRFAWQPVVHTAPSLSGRMLQPLKP
jgi:hypothetical protein